MKNFIRLLLFIVLTASQTVFAQGRPVLVLPVDIFNLCNNYYCLPEMSEIIATDTIKNFNCDGKIFAPNLYTVRNRLNTGELRPNVDTVVFGFKKENKIYPEQLKIIADAFNIKYVLIISSYVPSDVTDKKRGIWEILEISSAFNSANKFNLETNVVLVDAETGIVIWSDKFAKTLTDRKDTFRARNSSQAYDKYENIKTYSKNIVSKEIIQGVTQRFFPKTIEREIKQVNDSQPDGTFFRLNKTNPTFNEPKPKNDESFGEMIYGF